MRKLLGKIRKVDGNLRKNEESEALSHPGLWGWLQYCYWHQKSYFEFNFIFNENIHAIKIFKILSHGVDQNTGTNIWEFACISMGGLFNGVPL